MSNAVVITAAVATVMLIEGRCPEQYKGHYLRDAIRGIAKVCQRIKNERWQSAQSALHQAIRTAELPPQSGSSPQDPPGPRLGDQVTRALQTFLETAPLVENEAAEWLTRISATAHASAFAMNDETGGNVLRSAARGAKALRERGEVVDAEYIRNSLFWSPHVFR